jgi:hypothetical protein
VRPQAESLTKEAAELEAAIAAEVWLRAGQQDDGAAAPTATAAPAAATAPAAAAVAADTSATANGSAAGSSAAADRQPPANGAADAAAAPEPAPEADALDAFMHDMAEQAEADKVSRAAEVLSCTAKCPAKTSVCFTSWGPWGGVHQLGVVLLCAVT